MILLPVELKNVIVVMFFSANNPLYYCSIDINDEWVNNANAEFFSDHSDVDHDCGDLSAKVHVCEDFASSDPMTILHVKMLKIEVLLFMMCLEITIVSFMLYHINCLILVYNLLMLNICCRLFTSKSNC